MDELVESHINPTSGCPVNVSFPLSNSCNCCRRIIKWFGRDHVISEGDGVDMADIETICVEDQPVIKEQLPLKKTQQQ